jgi:hypothetical protein
VSHGAVNIVKTGYKDLRASKIIVKRLNVR